MGIAEETSPEGIRGLYPFLYPEPVPYAGPADRAESLVRATRDSCAGPDGQADDEADLRRSTMVKAIEIVRLREQVAGLYADRLAECAAAMAARFGAGGRLFTFGNGGSSTDAQQLATTCLHPWYGRPLPALSLTSDVALVTALSNDVGFEVVFARQIAALGRPGDMAVGLSTSGDSANLLQAFGEARRRGMLTVGMAGYQGGKLAELVELEVLDHLFVIPSSSVHRIQEAQTTVYHVLWELTQHVLASPEGGAG